MQIFVEKIVFAKKVLTNYSLWGSAGVQKQACLRRFQCEMTQPYVHKMTLGFFLNFFYFLVPLNKGHSKKYLMQLYNFFHHKFNGFSVAVSLTLVHGSCTFLFVLERNKPVILNFVLIVTFSQATLTVKITWNKKKRHLFQNPPKLQQIYSIILLSENARFGALGAR